jgi:hypothetical protein
MRGFFMGRTFFRFPRTVLACRRLLVGSHAIHGLLYQPRLREKNMFYMKNVPHWERALRVVLGLLGLGFAAFNWGVSGLATGAGIMGATLALTGLFGFCPMCALVGRKLNRGN